MIPPTHEPPSYEQLQTFLSDLSETIKRVKAQTGELKDTRDQIVAIDRALRGHDAEPGLIGRFVLLERSLTNLVEKQVPEMLVKIGASVQQVNEARDNLQACQLHHDLSTTEVKNDLARLRAEYQAHLDAEKKEQDREEKEEAKFGGREWFRANASAILVSVFTLIVNAGVTALIVSRLFPHVP